MIDISNRSPGQILAIFAGGLLALLLIAALVIDIGFVFWIQRQERNAADPGALAAARYIRFPTGGDTTAMFHSACFYARQNGFFQSASDNTNTSSGCVPANDKDGAILQIHYPPSINAGQFAGRPGFVEVAISRPHFSFLAQVIGLNRFDVASNAVAAFNNGDSNSNSLVALKSGECGTLDVRGTGDLTIQPVTPATKGGYMMVNSACGMSTDATPDQCAGGGSGAAEFGGDAIITAPHLYTVGSCKLSNNGTYSGGVTEGATYYEDPLAGLEGPPGAGPGAYCEPLGRDLVPGDNGCVYKTPGPFILNPGVYYGGIGVQSGQNPVLNMTPGIYIMAGGGFNASRGDIESASGDILIYSTDVFAYYGEDCYQTWTDAADRARYCQEDIEINGQVNIDLQGLALDPCPPVSDTGCPYVGLLFWQDRLASKALSGTPPVIRINGGSDLRLSGTVYNAAGEVVVNGGNSTTGCGGATQNCLSIQIIANTIKINGTADIVMPYDPSGLYHLDNKGLVR